MRADVQLDIRRKPFASGLLPELIAVLRRGRPGDLVAVVGDEARARPGLETWLPIHRRSTSRDYGRKGVLAVGLPVRSGSRACPGTGR
jgi:thiamine monophosphate kinase